MAQPLHVANGNCTTRLITISAKPDLSQPLPQGTLSLAQ